MYTTCSVGQGGSLQVLVLVLMMAGDGGITVGCESHLYHVGCTYYSRFNIVQQAWRIALPNNQ